MGLFDKKPGGTLLGNIFRSATKLVGINVLPPADEVTPASIAAWEKRTGKKYTKGVNMSEVLPVLQPTNPDSTQALFKSKEEKQQDALQDWFKDNWMIVAGGAVLLLMMGKRR